MAALKVEAPVGVSGINSIRDILKDQILTGRRILRTPTPPPLD